MIAFLWVFVICMGFEVAVKLVHLVTGRPMHTPSNGERAADLILTIAMIGWAFYLLGGAP